jgi:DeoR/GlpR family transcriptional regulator of sugar metabolism
MPTHTEARDEVRNSKDARMQRIRDEFEAHPGLSMNAATLANQLSVAPTTLRETLHEMVELGELTRDGNMYSLVADGDEKPTFDTKPKASQTSSKSTAGNRPAGTTKDATDETKDSSESGERDQAIFESLREKNYTKAELADKHGTSESLAYGSLWRLQKSGKVTIVGRNGRVPIYGVPVKEEDNG